MVLYAQSFDFWGVLGNLIPLLIFLGFMIIVTISTTNFWNGIFKNETIKNINIIRKWFILVGSIVLVIIASYLVLSSEIKPLIKYKTNNYEIVEGYVENFINNHDGKREEFTINGIKFSYWNKHGSGYDKTQKDGGVIEGNGQHLKIGYYWEGSQNEIVYIEELK